MFSSLLFRFEPIRERFKLKAFRETNFVQYFPFTEHSAFLILFLTNRRRKRRRYFFWWLFQIVALKRQNKKNLSKAFWFLSQKKYTQWNERQWHFFFILPIFQIKYQNTLTPVLCTSIYSSVWFIRFAIKWSIWPNEYRLCLLNDLSLPKRVTVHFVSFRFYCSMLLKQGTY